MRLVEFIGIPGSGKSTYQPFVKSYLRKRGQEAFDKRDLRVLHACGNSFLYEVIRSLPSGLSSALLKLSTNKDKLRKSYANQFSDRYSGLVNFVEGLLESNSNSEHKLAVKWFQNAAYRYELGTQMLNGGAYLLMDEGFMHKVLTLFVAPNQPLSEGDIQTYLNLAPRPEMLLHIQTDLNIATDRMLKRGRTDRLANLNDQAIIDYMEKCQQATQIVLSFCQKTQVPVFEIDNSAQTHRPKEFADRVQQVLRSSNIIPV